MHRFLSFICHLLLRARSRNGMIVPGTNGCRGDFFLWMHCRSSDRHHVKEGADRGGGPARAQSNEMQGHFGNGGRLLRGATFSQENGLSWTTSQAASAARIVARKTRCRVRRGSLRRRRGVFGQCGGVADRGPVRRRSGSRSGSGRRAALRRCMAPVREPRKNRHAPSSEGTGLGKVSLPELGGLPRGGCVRAFARRNMAAAARWSKGFGPAKSGGSWGQVACGEATWARMRMRFAMPGSRRPGFRTAAAQGPWSQGL